jgi:hypothetical protein
MLAAFAISTPIAPRPTIPNVFPGNSEPEYCFFPSSTVALGSQGVNYLHSSMPGKYYD